jgi:hypothetical protein
MLKSLLISNQDTLSNNVRRLLKKCHYNLDKHPEMKIGLYAARKYYKNVSTIGETLLGISSSFTDSMLSIKWIKLFVIFRGFIEEFLLLGLWRD